MSMSCDHSREQIGRALLDDLAREERQALEAHLAECPACSLEQELYAATVHQLRSTCDVAVPRHFFVHPKTVRFTPWHLFLQLSLSWRIATAATVILLLIGVGLLTANIQFKAENGIYSFSFGKPPISRPVQATRGADAEALKRELLIAVEEKIQNERLQLIHLLQSELKASTTSASHEQRQFLQAALHDVETRLNGQLVSTGEALQARNERTMLSLYGAWQAQRQHDLAGINDSLGKMVARGEVKEQQTDAILNTLIQVAELKTP